MKEPTQFAIFGLLIVICFVLTMRYYRRRRRRRDNPQDYAYFLHERFGSTLRLSPVDRVRRGLPNVPAEKIEKWIRGFSKVGARIDSLAQQGGTQALTWGVVKNRLQADFPFLQNEGLKQAMFLVDYIAWHDGYVRDKMRPNQPPQPTPVNRRG